MEERLTPSAGVQEQYMLALINRFRQNPAGELALILNANDANVNTISTISTSTKCPGQPMGVAHIRAATCLERLLASSAPVA